MQHIRPDIWVTAICIGNSRALVEETGNLKLAKALAHMEAKVDRYLDQVRKDKKK